MTDEHIERGREYLAEVKEGIKKALYTAQENYKARHKAAGLCIKCARAVAPTLRGKGVYCANHRAGCNKYYRDERARKKSTSTKEMK